MSTDLEIRKQYDLGATVNFAANAREELGDLFVPQFPRVKIPSGGSLNWQVPSGDPDRPDSVDELTGVIVAIKPTSRTYLTPFSDRDGDDSGMPDFYSIDGKTQVITPEGLAKIAKINADGGRDGKLLPEPSPHLASCPYNQWESAWMVKSKFGKATNNYLNVYLHTGGGAVFPLEVGLTSTNIDAFTRWVSSDVVGQSLRLTDTLVTFGLKKEKSKGNVDYSKVTYKVGERLDTELAAQYAEYAKGIKLVINDDPFARGGAAEPEEATFGGSTATSTASHTYVNNDTVYVTAEQPVPAGVAPEGAADLDI